MKTINNAVNDTLSYRTAPHNIEAEQALLGAILVNNEALQKVQGFLGAEHFYEPVHSRIFEAILKLVDKSQIADPVKLKPYFENDDALANVGGAQYLVRLAASTATVINAEDYGRTIYDMALRREIISIGEDMVNTAYDSDVGHEATSQIEDAEKSLFDLAEKGSHEGGFKSFSHALTVAVENIESAFRDPHGLAGTTTGLNSMDEMIGGMHKSDLVILAGRPAMGKTALATNIGYNAARRWLDDKIAGEDMTKTKGSVVGFFSLEMSADQLAARILADIANRHYAGPESIQSHEMRRGKLSTEQFEAIARAATELEDVPLYIDDTPALTIAGLRTRARRLKRQQGLGMIIVDYLQLLRGSSKNGSENRVQEISEITRGLKGLAKELEIPVLALSQLSRNVESRENKRPMLSDLRESGSIEQDADMVMFVFREEYYKEKEQPSEGTPAHDVWVEELQKLRGRAEVIVGKQRHGPIGTIRLAFHNATTRFADLVSDEYLPDQYD